MNVVNRAVTRTFDVLLAPLDALGPEWALLLSSGVFGILALIAFKYISNQKGIAAAKDKIKAHMIEIRLYQNDLAIVTKAIGKVLLRNFQYLALNFGPILPLLIPFVFVLAQLVVRYAFVPLPVVQEPDALLPGQGTLVSVEFADDRRADALGLDIRLPDGLRPLRAGGRPMRSAAKGSAYLEVVATKPGTYDITFALADGSEFTKRVVAGSETKARHMQPERVRSALAAMLWPAEDTIGGDSPVARVHFEYPDSDLGWLPGHGLLGVMLVFLIASMAFGFALLKPLRITI